MLPFVPINRMSLAEMAYQAGLGSSLQLCLDASSLECYPGYGQIIHDISGNQRHFYLGTDGGATTDPIFNGTAGSKDGTCYFSSTGAMGFMGVNANDAFINSLHKTGAEYTFMMIEWWTGSYGIGFNTKAGGVSSVSQGVCIFYDAGSNHLSHRMANGSFQFSNKIDSGPVPQNSVFMAALGIKFVAPNNHTFVDYLNGVYSLTNYTSETFNPSSLDGIQMRMGLTTDNSAYFNNGRRLYGFMLFSKNLTQANLDTMRSLIKTRHPGV